MRTLYKKLLQLKERIFIYTNILRKHTILEIRLRYAGYFLLRLVFILFLFKLTTLLSGDLASQSQRNVM